METRCPSRSWREHDAQPSIKTCPDKSGHAAHVKRWQFTETDLARSLGRSMFNLFAAKRSTSVEVVRGQPQLVKRMAHIVKSHQSDLDALGEEHPEIDLRLVRLIDQVLEPLIGPSGIDEHLWFQSLDWYGDGVRHLEFAPGRFPLSAIPGLQSLLKNEYSRFSILCWAPLDPGKTEDSEGVVIFSYKVVVTSRLATLAAMA
jgi:hypothetical protein